MAKLSESKLARGALLTAGFISLGFAILGALLPVLPTTVFVLIAAYCFARSSRRFYEALLNNRYFGATVRNWEQNRCIAAKSKTYAIALVAVTFSVTIVFFLSANLARLAMGLLGLTLALYLYRLPTCPGDQGKVPIE